MGVFHSLSIGLYYPCKLDIKGDCRMLWKVMYVNFLNDKSYIKHLMSFTSKETLESQPHLFEYESYSISRNLFPGYPGVSFFEESETEYVVEALFKRLQEHRLFPRSFSEGDTITLVNSLSQKKILYCKAFGWEDKGINAEESQWNGVQFCENVYRSPFHSIYEVSISSGKNLRFLEKRWAIVPQDFEPVTRPTDWLNPYTSVPLYNLKDCPEQMLIVYALDEALQELFELDLERMRELY